MAENAGGASFSASAAPVPAGRRPDGDARRKQRRNEGKPDDKAFFVLLQAVPSLSKGSRIKRPRLTITIALLRENIKP